MCCSRPTVLVLPALAASNASIPEESASKVLTTKLLLELELVFVEGYYY